MEKEPHKTHFLSGIAQISEISWLYSMLIVWSPFSKGVICVILELEHHKTHCHRRKNRLFPRSPSLWRLLIAFLADIYNIFLKALHLINHLLGEKLHNKCRMMVIPPSYPLPHRIPSEFPKIKHFALVKTLCSNRK